MNKRVYNKTFGKMVRTLGFLLILASSGYLATNLVLEYQALPFIDNLLPFANIADGILDQYPIVAEYAGMALVVGFILILWAIRRGVILRVVLTLVLLVGFIESSINGTSPLVPIALSAPSWLAGVLTSVEPYINQLTDISPYVVPGLALAVPFLLWVLFANKKPGRISILLFRLGSTVLFLAIAMLAAQTLFMTSLADLEIFGTINMAFYILTYIAFLIGSVFGVLGFARK